MQLFLILTLVLVPTLALAESATAPHCQTAVMSETAPHVLPIAQETKLDRCDSNDNNLWGRWECGGGDLILSHAFDSDGIEHVTFEKEKPIWGWDKQSYPVDEKWHSNTQTGKRDNVSCNGWNDRGFRVMSILTKENPGDRSAKYVDYYVNHRDVLWIKYGDIRKDQNGKITSEENYEGFCRRY